MTLVEILCDGGAHGLGHLRRASALGWAFRERGHKVRVTAASADGARFLPPSPSDEGGAGLSVLDLPCGVEEQLARRKPCVALDYFGSARPDLTISVLERASPPPPGRRLAGLEYAIVRPDVARRPVAPEGRGVLIALGGGDVRGNGPELARRLVERGEEVTLVQGPLAPAADVSGARCLRNPPDLVELMAGCRWAVANGGVTMTELLCLGKPVWVVAQTPDEERLARHVLERGGLLGVGDEPRHNGRRPERLIDGRGADRICAAVEELLS